MLLPGIRSAPRLPRSLKAFRVGKVPFCLSVRPVCVSAAWRGGGRGGRSLKKQRVFCRAGATHTWDCRRRESKVPTLRGVGGRSQMPRLLPSHSSSSSSSRHTESSCGYVAAVGLSGLLTGFPPFMTGGSLVLLLDGAVAVAAAAAAATATLGTVSPTSCNEGSRYMATGGTVRKKRRLARHFLWDKSDLCTQLSVGVVAPV